MPIQVIWGNDLNAQNTFIQELIDQKVSKVFNMPNLKGLKMMKATITSTTYCSHSAQISK